MKTETKHTPGPWMMVGKDGRLEIAPAPTLEADLRDAQTEIRRLEQVNRELLAACKRAELSRQMLARNLDIIKDALRSKGFDGGVLEGCLRGLEHARAAIEKAEGK